MTSVPTRNKIYAIVEGRGEQTAVPILLGRLLAELNCWTLFPARKQPYKMNSYGAFFRPNRLEDVVRLHESYLDCAALLILLDMDDDCPQEKAFILTERIQQLRPLPFSVVVVCAKCEYEAWFLASLETIEPSETFADDPEAIRDAKGWLKRRFGYRPTQDQGSYTRAIDFSLAQTRSRSFCRLYHAAEEIIMAHENGRFILTPTSS